jgi:hypothetical protein
VVPGHGRKYPLCGSAGGRDRKKNFSKQHDKYMLLRLLLEDLAPPLSRRIGVSGAGLAEDALRVGRER